MPSDTDRVRALLANDISEPLIDQWSQSCQSNMADVLSSSSSEEDDAVTNPIQLAINKGANITEPDRAAISRETHSKITLRHLLWSALYNSTQRKH